MAKKVAIIGGGWIGLQVAMNLEKADPKGEAVDVTIFDAKKHFYNNVAGLRLCVEPEFIVKAVVPRDQALKRSKIIQAGEVETIIPDGPALKLKARDEAISQTLLFSPRAPATRSLEKCHGGWDTWLRAECIKRSGIVSVGQRKLSSSAEARQVSS